jgi:hypothetical protein
MEVFPATERLEIFANECGSITLQQDDAMGDDSVVIVISSHHVEAVVKALRAAKKECEAD